MTVVAMACALSSVLLVAAPAQAAKTPRVTAVERAEAAQLLAPMKEFKAAADARDGELSALMATTEAEARRCPPPAGVPATLPKAWEKQIPSGRKAEQTWGRWYIAQTVQISHRLAALLAALRTELQRASAQFHTLRSTLTIPAFRSFARFEDRVLASISTGDGAGVDLCGFWSAWQAAGLDLDKGVDLRDRLVDRDAPGVSLGQRPQLLLRRVLGTRPALGVVFFPLIGRFQPRPLRASLAPFSVAVNMTFDFWEVSSS